MSGTSIFHQFFPEKFPVKQRIAEPGKRPDGNPVMGTDGKTRTATDTFIVIDHRLFPIQRHCLHLTAADAQPASFAQPFADDRLYIHMHCQFPPLGGKPHGELLDRSAESGKSMTFK